MHFVCQKTDWGAKGAPRGATTKINYHIWVPFGGHFSDLFEFLMEKSAYLPHIAFFLIFWGALSALGDGLISNPSTPVQSKHTFHCLHFFSKKVPWRGQKRSIWGNVSSKKRFLCKKMRSKNCFKKRCSTNLKQDSINRSGGSRRGSLACALFKQETVVRAAVEALFEILAEKSELGGKSVQKTDWIAESFPKKLNGLLKIVDC